MSENSSAAPAAHREPGEGKEAESEADRVPLRGLAPVPAPVDLSRTVPELIRRRSRGRFFSRRLASRLPLEWLSLGMLIFLAIIYVALKLLFS